MLVAIESPIRRVAMAVASSASNCTAPTVCSTMSNKAWLGNCRFLSRMKPAVIVSWVLTMARVLSFDILASASLLDVTTMSQPMTASASPAAIRTAWISSGRSAMRIWLITAPFFWATPV